MTLDEIKSKSKDDLKVLLSETKGELFKLRLQHSMGQLEKTHRLSELKKTVARANTLLKSKS